MNRPGVRFAITAVVVAVAVLLTSGVSRAEVVETVYDYAPVLWMLIMIVALVNFVMVASHLYPKKEY